MGITPLPSCGNTPPRGRFFFWPGCSPRSSLCRKRARDRSGWICAHYSGLPGASSLHGWGSASCTSCIEEVVAGVKRQRLNPWIGAPGFAAGGFATQATINGFIGLLAGGSVFCNPDVVSSVHRARGGAPAVRVFGMQSTSACEETVSGSSGQWRFSGMADLLPRRHREVIEGVIWPKPDEPTGQARPGRAH